MSCDENILYHYTSLSCLFGILRERCLHFNFFRTANDPRERYSLNNRRFVSFTVDGHCEGWRNPLMWYLYAKDYSGVCIAFDKERLIKLNSDVDLHHFKIIYSIVDLPDIKEDDILATKYKHIVWAGESEYRFVTNSDAPGLRVDETVIKKVYFKNRPTSNHPDVDYENILKIGLDSKLVNIGFLNGEVIEIPISRCDSENHFKKLPTIMVPFIKRNETSNKTETLNNMSEVEEAATSNLIINHKGTEQPQE